MLEFEGVEHKNLKKQMAAIPNNLEPFGYALQDEAFKSYKRSYEITHPNRSKIKDFYYYIQSSQNATKDAITH